MRKIAEFLCLIAAALAVSIAHAGQLLNAVADSPPARDFTLKDVDGKAYRLSDLHGKVVLVNFWATWCPPCRHELPSLERLWLKLKDRDFMVLAVNVAEDGDTVFAFTGQMDTQLTFPLLLDSDSAVLNAWPVKGLPTSYVIDRQGKVALRAVGGREFDHPGLVEQIQQLLK